MKRFSYVLLIAIILSLTLVSAFDWSDVLVYYDFDEGTGKISTDLVGDLDGNLTGDPQWVTGISGNALQFNTTNWFNSSFVSPIQGSDERTMNVWINWTGQVSVGNIFSIGNESTNNGSSIQVNTNGNLKFKGGGTGDMTTQNGIVTEGIWHMITFVWNGTNGSFYVDGSLQATRTATVNTMKRNLRVGASTRLPLAPFEFFNGTIDEVAIWDRNLTSSEILELWNGGNGLFLGEDITIQLINPVANLFTINSSLNFTAEYSTISTEFNLSNATYFVWDSAGAVFNNTVFVEIAGTSNSTAEIISNLIVDNYQWNVFTCYENISFSNCTFADSNFSLGVGIRINQEGFNNQTTEGTTERFELNVSVFSGRQVTSANLVYNSTKYGGIITNTAENNYTLVRNLQVPNIDGQTNFTFFWEVTLDNGYQRNTTSNEQEVSLLSIDDCSTFTILLLNYTLLDEKTKDFLTPGIQNTSIEVDLNIFPLGSTTAIINFSQNYSTTNPAQVCLQNSLLNNSEFRMDVVTRYESKDTVAEIHHIQNFTLINDSLPQNINLYGLNRSQSQKFLITFKGENFLPIGDALIDIQRRYISDGVFRSVEIPKTDQFGQATGHFDLDSVVYTIIISKNGEILSTFDNIAVICQDLIIEDCRLNLNLASAGTEFPEWEKLGGLEYTISFNNNTRTVTSIFSTTDGSSKTVLLNTTKYDRFGNQTVCSDTLTSSSGTLTCVIPESFGNVTVVSKLFSNGELITTRIYSIAPDARAFFGLDTIVMVLILLMTIPFMLVSSTIGLIVGTLIGLIMASALLMLQGGSIIGAGAALIWAVLAGGIIIWKINQKKGT